MFGHHHYDVTPDMVTLAKGIASSYMPLSANSHHEKIFDRFLTTPTDTFGYFRDISTYGGCTAGCSVALENIRIIEEEKLSSLVERYKFLNWPVIRGTVVLVETMIMGIRALNFSANQVAEAEGEEITPLEMTITMLISLVLAASLVCGRPVPARSILCAA